MPWFCQHGATIFTNPNGEISVTFNSPYCMKNCCLTPITVMALPEAEIAEHRNYGLNEVTTEPGAQGKSLSETRNENYGLEEVTTASRSQRKSPSKLRYVRHRQLNRYLPGFLEEPEGSETKHEASEGHSIEPTTKDELKSKSPFLEISAVAFHLLAKNRDNETFSLSLRELERALNESSPSPSPSPSSPMPITLPPTRTFKRNPAKCAADNEYDRNLHQMNLELNLTTMITSAELENYRKSKNVDPSTILPKNLSDFLDVFSKKEAEKLPPHRSSDHAIEIQPDKLDQLPRGRLYGMSRNELEELDRYLKDNLAKGFIRASKSELASPVLFVKKPGGGLRFCVDYRGLNAITVKNRYPLPLICETLDRLSRARIFTKLDIISAFNRIRIKEGQEHLTAFQTRQGLFEYLVLPFGLCNGPATFQSYINEALRGYLDDFVTAYLDDILIYSENELEHELHVKRVLQRLRDFGLQVDITKCSFNVTKVKYLGLIISTEGVRMDPEKIRTITEWPPIANVKDVQSFLGFANFYRRFIYNFSKIAAPLTRLTKKDIKWDWNAECQQAFDTLRAAFTSEVVLAHYDPEREIVVETDASDYVSAGILSQYDDKRVLRPIAYFSRKHSPAECNYEIYDKELMAIVRAFENWRPELEGSAHPIDIITDHKNLEYFTTTKLLSRRQARWAEFLSRFDFRIRYRPGTQGGKPDALTRRSGDLPVEGDLTDPRNGIRNRPLLKLAQIELNHIDFKSLTPTTGSMQIVLSPLDFEDITDEDIPEPELDSEAELNDLIEEVTLEDLWNTAYSRDKFASSVSNALQENVSRHPHVQLADCKIHSDRLYVNDKQYVPNSTRLRSRICQQLHDSVAAGHPGRTKMIALMYRSYWFPGLPRFVARWVRNCANCKRNKPSRERYQGWLRPLEPPQRRWTDICMDFVGPLPPSTFMGVTYRYILVVTDRLSKMRHFIPTMGQTAEEAATAFYWYVWKLHGTPERQVSDRGSQWLSEFWTYLMKRIRVESHFSTAYHPESDGQSERNIQSMTHYLRGYVNHLQNDWVQFLPAAEFAANNAESSTTNVSPFFANYGQHPRIGIEELGPQQGPLLEVDQLVDKMRELDTYLYDSMLVSQALQEVASNRHRRPAEKYNVGDMVFLDNENINTHRPSAKLDNDAIGPFRVIKVYDQNPLIVKLELPETLKIHPVFHVNLLQRAASDPLPGQIVQNPDPFTDEETGEDKWYMKAILDSKIDRRCRPPLLKYLVEWEGDWAPTWEPWQIIEQDIPDEMAAFHNAHPNRPGPHVSPCNIPRCCETPYQSRRIRRRVAGAPP
jgi:hypothetical protein